MEERKKRGIEPYDFTCGTCGKGTDQPRPSEIDSRVLMCPDRACSGTVTKNEKLKPESQNKMHESGISQNFGGRPAGYIITKDKLEDKQEKKSIILEG